jgi:hypothetical protein
MIPLIFAGITFLILTHYISFNLGRIKERKDWNKLIEDGVLPRPRKR